MCCLQLHCRHILSRKPFSGPTLVSILTSVTLQRGPSLPCPQAREKSSPPQIAEHGSITIISINDSHATDSIVGKIWIFKAK